MAQESGDRGGHWAVVDADTWGGPDPERFAGLLTEDDRSGWQPPRPRTSVDGKLGAAASGRRSEPQPASVDDTEPGEVKE